jgi:hypothetical protein
MENLICICVFTFYIILLMKYLSTNLRSMQKWNLRYNKILFHMKRQNYTTKSKGHPLINVNKKVDFKSVNFNNLCEIWQYRGMLIVLILYLINRFKWKKAIILLEGGLLIHYILKPARLKFCLISWYYRYICDMFWYNKCID